MTDPTDDLRRQLARRTEELALLERIAVEINSTLDLDRIFQVILETLDDVLGFKHSMILVPDDDATFLKVVASRGYTDSGSGARVEVGRGTIGVVAKKRRMMRLVGLGMQRRYAAAAGADAVQGVALPGLADARSQIAVPLLAKDRLLGVYAVESPAHDAFDAVDERLLSIVGQHIAIAIDNATAYRAVERTAAELRYQVAARSRELGDALAQLGQLAALDVGRVIDDRYRIRRKIGEGGMGAVFEVEHTSNGARFALKTLRGRATTNLMVRFAREAQIAARLQHPNLVPVIDVGISDGALFLVMPLVQGSSLEGQRPRFGDAGWARPLLAQTAAGLAALHANGIVHRDLKPANVLIANDVACIADFGIASLRDTDDDRALQSRALADTELRAAPLTQAGEFFGTPHYMAPELAMRTLDARASSDMFSFGVLAYELMSGRAPFAEPPVIVRLRGGLPIAPTKLSMTVVGELIDRCLQSDPEGRPSAREMEAALRGP
jgi:hypothetical protein